MNEVNPWMIVLARESQGLNQAALSRLLGIAQGTLSKIENGRMAVPDDLMMKLEEKLPYRRSFYYQSYKPEGLPASFFRKRARVASSRVKAIQANVNIMRQQVATMLRSVDVPELNLPFVDPSELRSIAPVARDVRERLSVPPGPIDNLTAMIENAGVVVIQANFETRQVDAISMYALEDQLPPMIFVNCAMPGDRQRFSLAHELGHIVLHHHLRASHEDIEGEANAFAEELLMPALTIGYQLNRIRSLRDLAMLKPHWRVSMQALIERAASLGRINPGRRKYLWAQMSRHGYRTSEPHPIEPEVPSLIQEIIGTHTDDLGYSEEELSEVLCVQPSEMRDRFGMTGKPAHLRLVAR